MIASGTKEITLLGQNVNSYGKDLDCNIDFSDLLLKIAEIPGDFLIRFMTSHPRDAGKKLFDTMASSKKIAKQLHLPFQSGSDRVLKAMNRHYNIEKYLDLIHYAKSVMPDLVLTSDVIVGFPGEPFNEIGQQVRKNSKFPITLTLALSNGSHGYFPTAEGHDEGGYESYNTPYVKGTAEQMADTADELLKTL